MDNINYNIINRCSAVLVYLLHDAHTRCSLSLLIIIVTNKQRFTGKADPRARLYANEKRLLVGCVKVTPQWLKKQTNKQTCNQIVEEQGLLCNKRQYQYCNIEQCEQW